MLFVLFVWHQSSPLDMMAHTSPPLTPTASDVISDVISDEVFSSIETDLDTVVRWAENSMESLIVLQNSVL